MSMPDGVREAVCQCDKLDPASMSYLFLLWTLAGFALAAQDFHIPAPSAQDLRRDRYHRVTSRGSPAPEPNAENTAIRSLLLRPDGATIQDAQEWYRVRRPQLVRDWTHILGKLAPTAQDAKWFGDITRV